MKVINTADFVMYLILMGVTRCAVCVCVEELGTK